MKKGIIWFATIIAIICVCIVASAETGWTKEGDYLCFYDENGVKVTGSQTISGNLYNFTDDGYLKGNGKTQEVGYNIYYIGTDNKLKTEWQIIDGYKYYFSPENGAAVRYGMVEVEGTKYCFNSQGVLMINSWYAYYYGNVDGTILTGYQKVGDQKYLFNEDGYSLSGFQTIDGKIHYFGNDYPGHAESLGWWVIGKSIYYFDPSTGVMQTSARTIDGKNYSFNEDGTLIYNSPIVLKFYDGNIYGYNLEAERLFGWQIIDNATYYFGANIYDAYARTGLCDIYDYDIDQIYNYYFDADGKMQTGWVTIDDKMYYYGSDGKRLSGLTEIDGETYYLNPSLQTGSVSIYSGDSNWFNYYFDTDGKMQTGWVTIDDEIYYYGSDGNQLSGLTEIDGETYYLNPSLQTGSVSIYSGDGNWFNYYFDTDGKMQTGWVTIDDEIYYYGSDGKRLAGLTEIDGETYYLNPSLQTGSVGIDDEDGNWYSYYFNTNGKMQTGWVTIDDKLFYYNEDGKKLIGKQEIDGATYYLDNSEGKKIGLLWNWDNELNEAFYYYFDQDGIMLTGWVNDNGNNLYSNKEGKIYLGWQTIDQKTYYFYMDWNTINFYKNTCEYLEKEKVYRYFYFDDNGALLNDLIPIGIKEGWVLKAGKWYYGDADGYAIIGPLQINDVWYCFNEKGEMISGWAKVLGDWYYAQTSGELFHDSWQLIGNTWYWFAYDGKMAVGWANIHGDDYYFNENGNMQTGWILDNDKWYYLQPSGKKYTGWLLNGSSWYMLTNDGSMATGWYNEGGVWYHFNDSGVMVTGWQEVNGDWYYFASSGQMLSGWQQIDGIWFSFDSSGTMRTGWLNESDVWFWFDENGHMVTGWELIDGKWEMFDEKTGEWLYTWDGN